MTENNWQWCEACYGQTERKDDKCTQCLKNALIKLPDLRRFWFIGKFRTFQNPTENQSIIFATVTNIETKQITSQYLIYQN